MKIAKDQSLHKLHKNTRVRLRKDAADVYTGAYAGSEAIIRQLGIDMYDIPMVYVEWDKSHWLYNDERDMWTFETHFDPIEEEASMTEENSLEVLKQVAKLLAPMLEGKKTANPPPEPEVAEKEFDFSLNVVKDSDEYVAALSAAFESASDAEAFLVLAIKPKDDPFGSNQKLLMPEIFSAYHSEPAGYTLHLAISELASALHGESVARILHDKFHGQVKDKDEPRRNPNSDS